MDSQESQSPQDLGAISSFREIMTKMEAVSPLHMIRTLLLRPHEPVNAV